MLRNALRKSRLFAVVAAVTVAASAADLKPMDRGEAERLTTGLYAESNLSFYTWGEKYVYQPGEQLTVRWTVKPNEDIFPYTLVVYRQNNQNGKRFYFPAGTETPTDIYGNPPATFSPLRPPAIEKGVLIGAGSNLGFPAVTIPEEYGMHTIVVEFRDYAGGRVQKAAYFKFGVVRSFEDISGNIESSRTLTNDKAYRLSGIVYVKNNAVLTIEPGTFVLGQPGSQPPSALIVTRDGKIMARGTKSRPIVMTSSQPFGQRNRGDWGGLVMLGRAPINVGANATGGNNQAGEFFIEGLPGNPDSVYGGSDATHDCGTLTYVRVEYAGSTLSPNNELNSFTWGGCGSGTVAENLQAIYGFDDSFEWFGGTASAKYLVGGLGADDYVDFQLGWVGKLQFGLFYQSPDERGNRGIEGDNSEYNQSATPLSNPQLYNMTFIGSRNPGADEANAPGIYLRRGAAGLVNNTLVMDFNSSGLFVDGTTTQAQIDNGNTKMDGVLFWNNNVGTNGAPTLDGQVHPSTADFAKGTRGQGRNMSVANPLLRRPYDYSDPDFRAKFGSPLFRAGWTQAPDDGFFSSVNFLGGIGDEDWTEEWTSFLRDSDIKQ
jgi:hypothetical protein